LSQKETLAHSARNDRTVRLESNRHVAGRTAQFLEGWKQFETDLTNFEMAEALLKAPLY
jgi:hypothetical protein